MHDADVVRILTAVNQSSIAGKDSSLRRTGRRRILHRDSPLWEIYFLFPVPAEKQQRMIEEIDRKNVNWAIVCHQLRLDGRDDLEFEDTHQYLWQHIDSKFKRLPTEGLPLSCELLHRK